MYRFIYLSVTTCSSVLFTLCVPGYLESFEELRSQEQDKMSQSQENIVSLLEHCSRVRRRRSRKEEGGGDEKGKE